MIRSTIINIVKEFLITIPNSLTMPPNAMRSMITSRILWIWRGMEMEMVMKWIFLLRCDADGGSSNGLSRMA